MNVVRKEGGEYPDCIVKYFNFNEYATHSESNVFFWGWSCFLDADLKKKHAHYDHRVFLDTASPCGFLGSQPDFIEKRTDLFAKRMGRKAENPGRGPMKYYGVKDV